MEGIIIYLVLGYWAVSETIYKNRILVSNKFGGIFLEKLTTAFILGWIFIPILFIKLIYLFLKNK